MRVEIEIEGMNALQAKLGKITNQTDDVLRDVILDLALRTQSKAVQGIQRGDKTGRTYRRRNVVHTASAPGQYPASDTGRLAGSVQMIPPGADQTAYVGTNVFYGPMLEFGTSRMAARPWLMPSFEDAARTVADDLRRKLEALL